MGLKALKNNEFTFWHYQIAGWALFILVSILQLLFYNVYLGNGVLGPELMNTLFRLLLISDLFAFLLSIGMRYIYRYLFKRKSSLRIIMLVVLLVSAVMTFLSQTFDMGLQQFFGFAEENREIAFYKIIYSSSVNVIVFIAWSGLYFGIKYWKQWNVEWNRAEKASYQAQTAQLKMLRYQLNPHFLFNSLNSISALIDEDKSKSKELLCELSEFLRYSLEQKNLAQIPLKEELKAIRLYLSIEKKRFEDKLLIDYDIQSEAMELPVLSFLLHPLVENAVKYGMKTTALPLRLNISASVQEESLLISVSNSGKLIVPGEEHSGTQVGLKNVQDRIQSAFAEGSFCKLEQIDDYVVGTILIKYK